MIYIIYKSLSKVLAGLQVSVLTSGFWPGGISTSSSHVLILKANRWFCDFTALSFRLAEHKEITSQHLVTSRIPLAGQVHPDHPVSCLLKCRRNQVWCKVNAQKTCLSSNTVFFIVVWNLHIQNSHTIHNETIIEVHHNMPQNFDWSSSLPSLLRWR